MPAPVMPRASARHAALSAPLPDAAAERDPFGRIGAGDPAWEQARQAWREGASLADLFGDGLFDLQAGVGRGQTNHRPDVFRLQTLLHREGKLDADATDGPTGYWGNRDDAAMRAFQKEDGLAVDGIALPGGESIAALRARYPDAGRQAAPSPLLHRVADGGSNSGSDSGGDRGGDALRNSSAALAGALGLDPRQLDGGSETVLRGLGAARFYHYLDRQDQPRAMADIERLRGDDPKLAGRLRAKIADSIANPVWEPGMMTDDRLDQALRETERDLKILNGIETVLDGGAGASGQLPVPVGRGLSAGRLVFGGARLRMEAALARMQDERARRRGDP